MKVLIDDELALQKLPEVRATFYFTDGKGVLFAGLTSNLYARINSMSEKRDQDDKIDELWHKAKDIYYDLRLFDMDSLVWYKSLLSSFKPYYNDFINIWSNYTYLAIDWDNAPFLSIKENTQTDGLFIGAFRSRFFLSDVLSIFNKYVHLPICPDNFEKCDLIDTEHCLSFCTQGNLAKFKELVHNYYLSSNNDLPDILAAKYNNYHNDLQFIEAEKVKIEATIILKYYKFLNFLNKTKSLTTTLELDGKVYFIEDGLLAEVSGDNSLDFREQNKSVTYRANELLAVNKNQLDERWIVYNFLEEHQV